MRPALRFAEVTAHTVSVIAYVEFDDVDFGVWNKQMNDDQMERLLCNIKEFDGVFAIRQLVRQSQTAGL